MKDSTQFRKILLTGATGQVGRELIRTLSPLGEVLAPSRKEFDLSQPEKIREKIREWKPDLIVNPAAYTAVDQAETEHELALTINADAPKVLAEESDLLDIPLISYSTDYIFDGKKWAPYSEDDNPNPLNSYGYSKLKGEEEIRKKHKKHIIFRTSGVFGIHRTNFVNTILSISAKTSLLNVVDDQYTAPTSANSIATITTKFIEKYVAYGDVNYGTYHYSGDPCISWCEFAKEIVILGIEIGIIDDVDVCPISTDQYPTIAMRPEFSCLSNDKINRYLEINKRSWKDDLRIIMTRLNSSKIEKP